MKKLLSIILLFQVSSLCFSQSRFSKHELSFNGFRNPSIGVEYRYKFVSFHAGYYLTNLKTDVTTEFIKVGTSFWFLPVGKRENPSSFYGSMAYLRGLTQDYKDIDAATVELGFRWMVWKGINLRLGVIALASEGKDVEINPTPGISYTFFFK